MESTAMPVERTTAQSETGALRRVLLMHVGDAFGTQRDVDREWEALGYEAAPDVARACAEYEAFERLLAEAGARIDHVRRGPDDGLTLDAIYVRDAAVMTDRGAILGRMGKPARGREPAVQGRAFEELDVPILGCIEGDGRLEGGDVVWLSPTTVAIGEGYRTNAKGIRQLEALLGPEFEVIRVPLPHWRGPDEVLHLMSMLSPLDRDLALAYSPLLPAPFRTLLLDRGIDLVEVPEAEVDMGSNALAVGPRACVLESANVETRRRLESAGVDVRVYEGMEISRKGCGGPTCLTRPLLRSAEG